MLKSKEGNAISYQPAKEESIWTVFLILMKMV